jgi:NADH-quinone oxidoreductase subunit L
MAGVILTAFYMTRQMIYVFFGHRRGASAHAHESPRVMTLPLIVLAVCTIALSAILTPARPWLHQYLSGAESVERGPLIQPMIFVSVLLVAVGVGLAVLVYRRVTDRDPLAFRFLENRMWIDELYDHTIIASARFGAVLSDFFDRYVWDGVVRGFGAIGGLFGSLTKGFDEHAINAAADDTTVGARDLAGVLSRAQSGQVQTYLSAIGVAMLALILLYVWLA